MTVSRPFLVAVVVLFSAVTTAASDAQESVSPRIRNACTPDAKRLCPSQKLGTTEMRYCMESRAQALSRTCVRALEDEGIVPRGHLRR